MTTFFAPPEVLTALSVAIGGSDPDESLAEGVHLRVLAGTDGVFPIAPFGVYQVGGDAEGLDVYWTDEAGTAVPAGELGGFSRAFGRASWIDDDGHRTVAVQFHPSGHLESSLLDRDGRPVAICHERPHLYAPAHLRRFRLDGDLDGLEWTRHVVDASHVVRAVRSAPTAVLGLPVGAGTGWYSGIDETGSAAEARVRQGAPLHGNPMDDASGPPHADVDDEDEWQRVSQLLDAPGPDGEPGLRLRDLVQELVNGDAEHPPWLVTSQNGEGDPLVRLPVAGTLQLAAVDPGIARWLGLAARLEPIETPLAVIGLVAIDPGLATRRPHLADWLSRPHPDEDDLKNWLLACEQLQPVADEMAARIRGIKMLGFLVRVVVAVTEPAPPWLPPELPAVDVRDRRWHDPGETFTGSGRAFRAAFAFPGATGAALAAVARGVNGDRPGTRHVMRRTPRHRIYRADPWVYGTEADSGQRLRDSSNPATTGWLQGTPLLADHDIPADQGQVVYAFRAGDLFGRFGAAALETEVRPPPPPAVPTPMLDHQLIWQPPDASALPATGKRAPGVIRVIVQVPGPDELPAGSPPIESMSMTMQGLFVSGSEEPVQPGRHEALFQIEELSLGEKAEIRIRAVFTNGFGDTSAPGVLALDVRDRRLPARLITAPAIHWTSPPGPAPDVHLTLRWEAPDGARYRVYLTDRNGVGVTVESPRFLVAELGVNGGQGAKRTAFRLLDTVTATGGWAEVRTALPRSLRTVQFVRIVPVTDNGVEADFTACGLIAVAVPDDRPPPPPRLSARVDDAGRVTLMIGADLDLVALRADEPGLFGDSGPFGAPASAVPPRYRVRRSASPVPAPTYAALLPGGDLNVSRAADGTWTVTGTPTDGPLEPYVPYRYWAEVQMPPEHRAVPGVPLNVPPGVQVTTTDPEDMQDRPRPFSTASAPQSVMYVPPTPPPAPVLRADQVQTLSSGELRVQLVNPPVAHPAAVAPYRVALWAARLGHPLQAITGVDSPTDAHAVWATTTPRHSFDLPAPTPGAQPPTLRMAYVDPLGRMGPLASLTVRIV